MTLSRRHMLISGLTIAAAGAAARFAYAAAATPRRLVFVIQRGDCDVFAACAELDPAYARGLDHAAANGVEVLAYRCALTPDAVTLADPIPWRDAA